MTKSKIERINTALEQMDADGLNFAHTRFNCRTFNIRGNDVDSICWVAYAYISKDESIFFIEFREADR